MWTHCIIHYPQYTIFHFTETAAVSFAKFLRARMSHLHPVMKHNTGLNTCLWSLLSAPMHLACSADIRDLSPPSASFVPHTRSLGIASYSPWLPPGLTLQLWHVVPWRRKGLSPRFCLSETAACWATEACSCICTSTNWKCRCVNTQWDKLMPGDRPRSLRWPALRHAPEGRSEGPTSTLKVVAHTVTEPPSLPSSPSSVPLVLYSRSLRQLLKWITKTLVSDLLLERNQTKMSLSSALEASDFYSCFLIVLGGR